MNCSFQAGIASGTPSLTHLEDAEWDQMMHVNTTSCFLAVKYAAPAMMKIEEGSNLSDDRLQLVKQDSSGSIILTASVAGLKSGAGPVHSPFMVTKFSNGGDRDGQLVEELHAERSGLATHIDDHQPFP
ncbi:hypothetical protein FRC17_003447 [Serendipita sp. 399]|nr:hypothetical protein FRC17_003447 [Serendipita sp. 399]